MKIFQMKLLTNILSPINKNKTKYIDNVILEIENNIIIDIQPYTKNHRLTDIQDRRDIITMPGLIDTHTHLPQLPIIGKYGKTLLEWLEKYTFPAERDFKDTNYAQNLSKKFFNNLKSVGTTTAVVYSTVYKDSTDIAFQEAEKSNLRIIMGKVMMDQNSPFYLQESPVQSLEESITLSKKWHQKNKKLYYAYSPRFAIACSIGTMSMIAENNMNKSFIQTHCNENIREKEFTKELYPDIANYVEVYNQANILGKQTILAHMVHNSRAELEIIKKTQTKIVHCPDANLFLKSGRFPIEDFDEMEIDFGLGSDVGAGTTLNMFQIMKSMIYMQSNNSIKVSPERAYWHATIANSQILGLFEEIGSIDKGKRAEIIGVKVPNSYKNNASDILSYLIFTNPTPEIEIINI